MHTKSDCQVEMFNHLGMCKYIRKKYRSIVQKETISIDLTRNLFLNHYYCTITANTSQRKQRRILKRASL